MQVSLKGFRKIMLIVSLLALNIVEQAATAVSGTIPQMGAAFPHQSQVQIELVTTVVSISVTIFVIVSGFMSKWIGQKNTAILGLGIASVASIIPALSSSFDVIMISRAILGVGIGLANPLAISLIGEFFGGDELATLMGWRTAVASIGVSLMTFFAGQLLNISWHAAYWVYLLFIPTLILFVIFVPSPEKAKLQVTDQGPDTESEKKSGHRFAGLTTVIVLSLLILVYMSSAMVAYIKLAMMYVQTGIGTPTQASTVISIFGFSQLIGGALFGISFKILKHDVLPFGIGLSGLMMVLMTFMQTNSMILIFGALSGFFGGLAVPYIFTKVNMISTTKSAPLNNALVLVGSNIGAFVAPMLANMLGATALISLRNAGFLIIGLTVIILIVYGVVRAKATVSKLG